MPTIEERMAAVEARLDTLADLRALIVESREEMRHRFNAIDHRFNSIDQRFLGLEKRIDGLAEREDRHYTTTYRVQISVALMMMATLLTLAVI